MKALIIHGSFGSPEENWIPWLRTQLEEQGYDVMVPQFPVDDYDEFMEMSGELTAKYQIKDSWISALEPDLVDWIDEATIVVAHSIAPVFVLHVLAEFSDMRLKAGYFVCPFLESFEGEAPVFNAVNKTFYKNDFDFQDIASRIEERVVFYSDNDPYIPQSDSERFANKLDAKKVMLTGAGHINSSAGYMQFAELLNEINVRRLLN